MTSFTPRISVVTSLYHGYRYLAGFLENVWEQTCFPDLELVLVHNEPEPEELSLIQGFMTDYPHQVQHILVEDVESLGASWNRGWATARGRFVSIWNVDDRRTPDSLVKQVQAMEACPDCVMCYGPYIRVPAYGSSEGLQVDTPEFKQQWARRSFSIGGAFMMFRREIQELAGPFDEQFTVAVDMEYGLRLAVAGHPLLRVDSLLGYFTSEQKGLSTRGDMNERGVMETQQTLRRYAIYDKLNPQLDLNEQPFRQDEILSQSSWIPLTRYVPKLAGYRRWRFWLRPLGWLRFTLRDLLVRFGWLERVHELQNRFIGRDL